MVRVDTDDINATPGRITEEAEEAEDSDDDEEPIHPEPTVLGAGAVMEAHGGMPVSPLARRRSSLGSLAGGMLSGSSLVSRLALKIHSTL